MVEIDVDVDGMLGIGREIVLYTIGSGYRINRNPPDAFADTYRFSHSSILRMRMEYEVVFHHEGSGCNSRLSTILYALQWRYQGSARSDQAT